MTDQNNPPGLTVLDFGTYSFSFVSILATAYASLLVIPNMRHGLYGGTAIAVGMIVGLQLTGFLFAVVVPYLFSSWRGQARLTRLARWMLFTALFGLSVEIIVLATISIAGNC